MVGKFQTLPLLRIASNRIVGAATPDTPLLAECVCDDYEFRSAALCRFSYFCFVIGCLSASACGKSLLLALFSVFGRFSAPNPKISLCFLLFFLVVHVGLV